MKETKTYHLGKPMTIEEIYANEILQKNDWDYLSQLANLQDNIIEEFQDKLNWKYISRYKDLNTNKIDFIEIYIDLLDWGILSKYQKLSENDIEHFKDYVDWDFIGAYQNISFKFIFKYWDKFDLYGLSLNKYFKQYNSKYTVLKLVILYIQCKRLIYKVKKTDNILWN